MVSLKTFASLSLALSISLLGSLPAAVVCESSPKAEHSNLRRATDDGPVLTIGGSPPREEVGQAASFCVATSPPPPLPSGNTIGQATLGSPAGYSYTACDANSDCGDDGCCNAEYCLCQGGPIPGDNCVADAMPDPAVSHAVAAWYQCNNEIVCADSWLNEVSCSDSSECEGTYTCGVFCYGMKQFCYYPDSDECFEQACDSIACAIDSNGQQGQCVDEFTYECGPRVCKNKNLPPAEIHQACTELSCTDNQDCIDELGDGFECVGEWEKCGIA